VKGAEFDRLKKDGLLSFLSPEGYDEALVQQALGKIKDAYQRDGYYHVQVDAVKTLAGGVLHLTLTVQPGSRFTLEEVRFQGNKGVSAGDLAQLMAVSEKRLLSLGSGRLVQSELDQDLDNIRSYYARQGYTEAKVGPPRVEEKGDRLKLTIPIVE